MSYLIATDSIQPMILVFVNGRNMFYGSFYTNSEYNNNPVFGMHEDYIISELIPYIENQALPKYKLSGERYIAGYSMGGYGAFMLAAKHPEKFQKAAALSGPHAFALFALSDSARAGLFKFFNEELVLDSILFQTHTEVVVNDSLVATIMEDTIVAISGRLPLGLDTLLYMFSKPGDTVVDTMIGQIFSGDTIYRVYYRVIHTFGYYPKSFTMYMTALSAAFTPKLAPCSDFNVLENEYIAAIVDSTTGLCAGLRLPVYKDLRPELVSTVIDEWTAHHDVRTLIQNNGDNILSSGIKWYMSSGFGTGDDLETVIYNMNKELTEPVFRNIYGDNFDDYVKVNYYNGSTDPFEFPATHNQYIYEELGNVLRFFGGK